MEKELAPILKKAILKSKGINIKSITAQALMMGDECHNRNVAGTSLFLKEILPFLLETAPADKVKMVTDFISGNVHFYLNLSMPACKATCDTIMGLDHCTLMSAMARNGTEIGIRIAGLGDQWFTSPSGMTCQRWSSRVPTQKLLSRLRHIAETVALFNTGGMVLNKLNSPAEPIIMPWPSTPTQNPPRLSGRSAVTL